jgi:hypothetical protein
MFEVLAGVRSIYGWEYQPLAVFFDFREAESFVRSMMADGYGPKEPPIGIAYTSTIQPEREFLMPARPSLMQH